MAEWRLVGKWVRTGSTPGAASWARPGCVLIWKEKYTVGSFMPPRAYRPIPAKEIDFGEWVQ